MNFEDEPYTRLYNRRTHTNRRLRWEGRCVMHELHYELDRAGIFEFSGDVVEAIELATGIPRPVVEEGLKRLLETETLVIRGNRLVWPRWLEAQTAQRTDRVRKQEERARRRDLAKEEERTRADVAGLAVTKPDKLSGGVTVESTIRTEGPPKSQPVTLIRTVPILAEANADSDARGGERDADDEDSEEPGAQPPVTLVDRAVQWVRNPNDAQLRHGSPETWPEVLKVFEGFCGIWPAAGKLRSRDMRAQRIVERFAEGFTVQDLVDAAHGAAKDPHIAGRVEFQTPNTVWRDAGQIDKYIALLRAPARSTSRNGRPAPEQATAPGYDPFAEAEAGAARELAAEKARAAGGTR